MRTKTLLAAAFLAAGLATSSMAADVYSQNVVGYVNLTLTNGFNMIANQLDADGTGTNNTINTVFTNKLPVNTTVYAFKPAGGYAIATYTKTGWATSPTSDMTNVNNSLNVANGLFVNVPSAGTTNMTLVGTVMQGALSKPYIQGFNLSGSQVPQAGLLQTDLNYVPTVNDTVYRFNPGAPYSIYTFTKTGWAAPLGQPSARVGEGFWINSAKVGGGAWTRNFTVN